MSGMNTIQKICFIGAWAIVGATFLAVILFSTGVGDYYPTSAMFGQICVYIFVGLTACFSLLNLSGWFKSSSALFIIGWVVAGIAAVGTICELVGNSHMHVSGELTTANFFWDLILGVFCTVLLLRLSGKFGKEK